MWHLPITFVLSLQLIVLSGNVYAQPDQKKIKVRAEYWEQYTHADGSGYFYEVLKAIYEPLGYQLEFKFCPWKRCVLEMRQGKADIIIGIYQEEAQLDEKLQTPQYPIHAENNAVVFNRESIAWLGKKSLKDKRVAQVRGYEMDKYLTVPVKTVEVSNLEQGMRLVVANRVEFFLSGKHELERERERYGESGERLQIETVFQHDAYLGFSQSNIGTQLSKEFDKGYIDLYKKGELRKLQQKWNLEFPLKAG